MKGKLTVLIGISGSGKSTWAHKEWSKDPLNTLIVSRDSIRESMFGFSDKTLKHYFNNEKLFSLEREVSKMCDTMIYEGLEKGKHVICDDNHLELGAIEQYKFWNVLTAVEVFNETLVQAIMKDRGRVKQFGDEAIKIQYSKFKQLIHDPRFNKLDFTPVELVNNSSKPRAVLFDIDGTLAHMHNRSPYDWKKVGEDTVDWDIAYIQNCLAFTNASDSPTIFVTTARDGIAEFNTKKWLLDNGIKYDSFLIKEQGDLRSDWVVKEEMWRELVEDYYIVGCFEDSLSVVRRGRALGLKMFNVQYNHY